MTSAGERGIQLLILVVIIGGWQVASSQGWMDPFFFPLPSDIIRQVGQWLSEASFYNNVVVTLSETVLGYVIGTALGVAGGIWLGLSRRSARILDPFVKALNAIPRVVLAPIFILWLGLGLWSKVALAVTLVFFVTFFNAMQGVREVDNSVLANARVLGASKRQLLRHVYFPAAATWILSSLRTSVGFAVVGAVIGEYIGSAAGLGHVIAQAQGNFNSAGVFAGIVVLSAFVLIIDAMLDLSERHLVKWRNPTAGI